MNYNKLFLIAVISSTIMADSLRDYAHLTDAIYTAVSDVRKCMPHQQWSERFNTVYKTLSEDVVPCSGLRYLLQECCACLHSHPFQFEAVNNRLAECCRLLDCVPYEDPDLSPTERELYRSCCKHVRCMVVDNTITVGDTFTANNININTGVAQFFTPPIGRILEYAYLYSQNEASRPFNTNTILPFDMGAGTSHFISSPDFALSFASPGIANGITAPAGVYLFYFRVQALDEQAPGLTPVFVGLSRNGNTATPIAGTQFSSDQNNAASADVVYVITQGAGIITLSEGDTIGILNKVGQANYLVDQFDNVQSSLVLVRIRTV